MCGVQHAACGPATTHTPVDLALSEESKTMGAPRKYNTKVHGYDTVLSLNDDDAKARGLTDADLVDAQSKDDSATSTEKARTPANKARTPGNKAGT